MSIDPMLLAHPPAEGYVDEHGVFRKRMTRDEFFALPDDPTRDRELIRGELVEREMTVRNWKHAKSSARIAQRFNNALDANEIKAEVCDNEVGVQLPTRDSVFGVDVAVIRQEDLEAAERNDTRCIEGVPLLVVEILSKTDQVGDLGNKVREYLAAGVPAVWIVDPYEQTVIVHAAGSKPRMLSGDDLIDAEPAFSGLSLPTRKLFER